MERTPGDSIPETKLNIRHEPLVEEVSVHAVSDQHKIRTMLFPMRRKIFFEMTSSALQNRRGPPSTLVLAGRSRNRRLWKGCRRCSMSPSPNS